MAALIGLSAPFGAVRERETGKHSCTVYLSFGGDAYETDDDGCRRWEELSFLLNTSCACGNDSVREARAAVEDDLSFEIAGSCTRPVKNLWSEADTRAYPELQQVPKVHHLWSVG